MRKEIALEKYANGSISLGKAAEFTQLTTWEFLQILKERNIPINLTKDHVLDGIDNLI